MNGLFFACVVLAVVSVNFVTGVICYCIGRWNERKAWNDYLGLPERTAGKPHFTAEDIGKCVATKARSGVKK